MFSKLSFPRIFPFVFQCFIFLIALGFLTACKGVEFPMLMALGELRGPYHNTTTVSDLDGNGTLDVVLINLRQENEITYWGNVTYWYNQGNGSFSSITPELPPYLYLSAAAGDLDHDGDADLLLLAATQLMPYINQGGAQEGETGVLKAAQIIYASEDPGTPGTVYLGDLDNNGELDAFVAGCCGFYFEEADGTSMYLHSNAFTWINHNFQATVLKELGDLRMRGAALGDLDRNGSLDVFVAILTPKGGRPGDPGGRVFINDGAGNFHDSGQRLSTSDSTAVDLGDLDGDGDLDAIVGTLSGATVWINQGGAQGDQSGIFASSGQELAGDETKAIFLEDFDADGRLEAFIASKNRAVIWRNDGQGTFKRSNQLFRFSERHGLAIGDFNGDGYPDIFAGSYHWAYRVWFNRGNGTFRIGQVR